MNECWFSRETVKNMGETKDRSERRGRKKKSVLKVCAR